MLQLKGVIPIQEPDAELTPMTQNLCNKKELSNFFFILLLIPVYFVIRNTLRKEILLDIMENMIARLKL